MVPRSQAAYNRKAHVAAAAAAHARTQGGSADLHAVIAALHGRIAAVAGTALLISVFTAGETAEKRAIVRIIRVECAGGLCMVESDCVVADLIVSNGTVVVPWAAPVLDLFENIQTLAVVTVLNIVQGGAHVLLVFAFVLGTGAACPVGTVFPAAAAAERAA